MLLAAVQHVKEQHGDVIGRPPYLPPSSSGDFAGVQHMVKLMVCG